MKKAFTMIEVVFVLIVIGILVAVIMPELKSNKLREAAIQVASHIRYTQHLAMVDDKYDSSNPNWYRERWIMLFGTSNSGNKNTHGKIAYSIFSDRDNGTGHDSKPNLTELAFDTINRSKYLSGGYSGILDTYNPRANKGMNLGISYDVDVYFKGGCESATIKRITFDHLGRPIKGTINRLNKAYEDNKLIQTRCEIVLEDSEGSVTIAIEPETGYTHILD